MAQASKEFTVPVEFTMSEIHALTLALNHVKRTGMGAQPLNAQSLESARRKLVAVPK